VRPSRRRRSEQFADLLDGPGQDGTVTAHDHRALQQRGVGDHERDEVVVGQVLARDELSER